MHKLRLVTCRHHNHPRQAAQIRHVERTCVRLTVGTHKTRSVDRKAHRQLLDRHVVHNLIVGPLQECRVDRRERLETLRRQARAERHTMLLRDPHVERAIRMRLLEQVQTRPVRHRRRDRNHPVVLVRFLDQAVRKHLCVGWRIRHTLVLRPRDHIKLRDTVILVGRVLRWCIALALHRHAMQQHRARNIRIPQVLQHRYQVVHVVTVDRPHVVEPEFLEQRAARHHAAGILFRPLRRHFHRMRQLLRDVLAEFAQLAILLRRQQTRQVIVQRPHRWGDRHLVVVQDHDQLRAHCAGVVHRLVGHARRHRAVADHRDHVAVLLTLQVAAHRETQARRDRGRGMRRTERIVFTLGALGEARQATPLAQRMDPVPPARQNLVRITLMTYVPDQNVPRRVKHIVDCCRKLHHTQTRTKVTARLRDRVHRRLAQLVRQLTQFTLGQTTQI